MSFGKRQPVGFGGVERRRAVREKSDLSARILMPDGQSAKCLVTDFSRIGARLAVPSAFGLPDAFDLRAAGRRYHVEVIRRGIAHVGVVFVYPATNANLPAQ